MLALLNMHNITLSVDLLLSKYIITFVIPPLISAIMQTINLILLRSSVALNMILLQPAADL